MAKKIIAVDKAMDVLLVFERFDFKPVPVKEIVENTGYTRDSVDRILATFEEKEMCKKDERNRWMLGARMLRLSDSFHKFCLSAK